MRCSRKPREDICGPIDLTAVGHTQESGVVTPDYLSSGEDSWKHSTIVAETVLDFVVWWQ